MPILFKLAATCASYSIASTVYNEMMMLLYRVYFRKQTFCIINICKIIIKLLYFHPNGTGSKRLNSMKLNANHIDMQCICIVFCHDSGHWGHDSGHWASQMIVFSTSAHTIFLYDCNPGTRHIGMLKFMVWTQVEV